MKYLFLDVDFVLNSYFWNSQQYDLHGPACLSLETPELQRARWQLDPAAVSRLDRFVKETGCQVVVSSTWREVFDLPTLQMLLAEKGYTGTLLDRTPSLGYKHFDLEAAGLPPLRFSDRGSHPVYSKHWRGVEIEAWILRKHLTADEREHVRLAIVDDKPNMSRLLPWLVKTPTSSGWMDEHSDKLKAKFDRPLGNLLQTPNPLLRPEALCQ